MELEDNKLKKDSVTMVSVIITQKIEFFCPFLIHILLCFGVNRFRIEGKMAF